VSRDKINFVERKAEEAKARAGRERSRKSTVLYYPVARGVINDSERK
jgi:hypothetical protein